jgi:hypothetical protein
VRGQLTQTRIDLAVEALVGEPNRGKPTRFGELCTFDQPRDRASPSSSSSRFIAGDSSA